jgi:hypothetical protein
MQLKNYTMCQIKKAICARIHLLLSKRCVGIYKKRVCVGVGGKGWSGGGKWVWV